MAAASAIDPQLGATDPKYAFRVNALSRLASAERNGLKIAIALRTAVVGVGFLWWLSLTLALDFTFRMSVIGVLGFYTVLGLVHYTVIGTRHDRPWLKFVVVTLDALGICAAFAFVPISNYDDIPQVLSIRIWGVHLLIPIIVLAGLTLSWRLVIWAGIICSVGWLALYLYTASGIATPLSWDDLSRQPTLADYQAVFLSIDFVGRGNRAVEIGIMLTVSIVLAVTVYRARQVFLNQLRFESQHASERQKRRLAADTLKRFVPEPIAKRLLDGDTRIEPEERPTSILMLDIADFSTFAAAHTPGEVIAALDDYLSQCAQIIADEGGVTISYTGDGLLASFNNPIPQDTPQFHAFMAAEKIVETCASKGFACRIGLSHGAVVAGKIGTDNRQAFTVYGETVNIAARLEQRAKGMGKTILLDGSFADSLPPTLHTSLVYEGQEPLRGISRPVELYSIA
ncbi:adenylate/guanylate cyclase domain-containing protein [Pseudahrensia aquimaris]|uniref:Adenylate/guanylate cyclase domain-containing protein n=1 Tax=Pseudahrensia aquimaris TaxID=744461 RepID=A0ABW3FDQ8_9HYPH